MSLLLDALKKAEKHKSHDVPTLDSLHSTTTVKAQKTFLNATTATRGIILILVILAIGSFFFFKKVPLDPQTTKATPPKASVPTQLPKEPSQSQSSSIATSVSSTTALDQETEPTDNADGEIESLYKDQEKNTPSASAVITSNLQNSNSLDRLANYANLPDLHDLPPEFLNKIPSLNYSEHHYSQTGASVVINGQVKHVQDLLTAGVTIEKIVEDGIILHGDVYTFKMRALNSWVNM